MMFRTLNFRSWFTFLERNKRYTAINFFGLSIALSMIVLISAYTIRQLSTDRFHEKGDRIYLVTTGRKGCSAYYLQKYLRDRYPEIESTTAVASDQQDVFVGNNRDKFHVDILYADSTFFDIFTVPLLEGERESFRADRRNIVISETFARRLVGNQNALSLLGQRIVLSEDPGITGVNEGVIAGIVRAIDNSVLPACDLIVRAERVEDINWANNEDMSNAGAVSTFLLAREHADLQSRCEEMLAYFKEFYWPYQYGHWDQVGLMPLREVYFSNLSDDCLRHGNRDFVLILFSVAFVLLLFAVINYINLTMAQTGMRAKEMAARRLLGATKGEIFTKLMLESILFTALSALLALGIADLATPTACRLLDYDFTIWSVMSPLSVSLGIAAILLIGLLSGLLPALAIVVYKPIDVVKGSFRSRTKMLYSRIFIAFQHTITVAMLIAAVTIWLQIRHMIRMPLGYNTEDVLVVDNDIIGDKQDVRRFVDELRKLPSVEAVGVGNGTPLRSNNLTMRNISFQQIRGDDAYFKIFGLRIKRDNRPAERCWYFNEYTFKELGVDESVPEIQPDEKNRFTVGGVYYDFRLFHAMRKQSAAFILNDGAWDFDKRWPWQTVIKTGSDHVKAVADIRAMLETTHPEVLWNDSSCYYMTDKIRSFYEEQDRLMRIVLIFTVLAMLISALGLLAISTYYILQRRQEIAVRKVFGAQHGQIIRRLVGSFLWMVAIGSLAAVPFAAWGMHRWLADYSYRIGLSV